MQNLNNKIFCLLTVIYFNGLFAFSGEITNSFLMDSLNLTVDNAKQILNSKNIEMSNSAFFKSVEKGNQEVVNAFLILGYDINKQKFLGETPLILAVKKNNYDLAKFLLYKGANVDAVTNTGQTAMGIAITKKNEKIIKLLISYGCQKQGIYDITPLDYSVREVIYRASSYISRHHRTIENKELYNIDKNNFNNPVMINEDIRETLYEIDQKTCPQNENTYYEYCMNLANKYYLEKNYKLSFKYVNYALFFFKESKAYSLRGRIYDIDKEYARAVHDFKRVIAIEESNRQDRGLSDNYYIAYNGLASDEIRNNNLDKALKYSQIAIKCHNYYPEIYKNYGNILTLLGKEKEAQYYLAIYNEIELIDKKIAEDPHNADLYYKKAQLYNDLPIKNNLETDKLLYNAISISPKVEYYVMLGDINNDIRYYQQALSLDAFNGLAFVHRGNYYYKHNKYQEALNDYLKAEENGYIDDDLLIKIARTYYHLGNNNKTFEYLDLVEKKYQNIEKVIEFKLDIYLESRDYINAIKYLDKMITLNPKNSELYMLRGYSKEKNNNINGAVSDYTKAINIDITSVAWYHRGNIYYRLGNIKKALFDADKYIEYSDSNDADGYYLRANCYFCLNNYKEALFNYNEANIYTTEGLYRRAYCKYKVGDIIGAIYDLMKIQSSSYYKSDRANYLKAVKLLNSI